jgi:HPt (histidine-containing phosphotransfer) domain-containing protein
MPGRDGYEVCQAMRRSKELAAVPVIIYSGQDSHEFVSRGQRAGADLCIRKTSKSSELLDRVEEVFAKNLAHIAATDVTDAESHFDRETALENVNHDAQLLRDLIDVMQEESKSLMVKIDEAIVRQDTAALQQAAHTIKGSLIVIGADRATELAQQLEQAAGIAETSSETFDWGHAASMRNSLHQEVAALMQELATHRFLS